MSAPARRRLPGGWQYDGDESAAALMLSQWGLQLGELDDYIEHLHRLLGADGLPEDVQKGLRDGVKFFEGERVRVLALVRQDAAGLAARDAARVLALALRGQTERPALLIGQRRQAQMQGFSQQGAKARRKYTDEDRNGWRLMFGQRFAKHTKSRAAELIAAELQLPATAVSSIRDALKDSKKADKPLRSARA